MRLIITAMLAFVCGCIQSEGPMFGSDAGTEAPPAAVECWQRMRATRAQLPPEADKVRLTVEEMDSMREQLSLYWASVLTQSSEIFIEYARDGSPEGIAYIVRRFGKEGTPADVRLVFGPLGMLSRPGAIEDGTTIAGVETERLREIVAIVKREQVKMFLEDERLLDRYYRAALWRGVLIGPSIGLRLEEVADSTAAGFAAADLYWDYAWSFVLLAHATQRDDLLQGVDADKLEPQFRKWHDWLKENIDYLTFDVQKLVWRPSADWRFWSDGATRDRMYWLHTATRRGMIPVAPFDDWSGPPLNLDVSRFGF